MNNRTKPIYWLIFVVYIILLIKVIFLNMPLTEAKELVMSASMNRISANIKIANFIPFRTIGSYMELYFKPGIKNLGLPILWFIPLGFFIPTLTKQKRFKQTAITGLLIIIAFEVLQIILSLGRFDVDDIILNGIGLVFGFMVYKAMK